MNMYIKVCVVTSMFVGSVLVALTPVSRAHIQELTRAIKAGTITGTDIIQQIQNLKLSAQSDPIIDVLNNAAVTALQKENYPNIKATTDLVTAIRENKITMPIITVEQKTQQQQDNSKIQEYINNNYSKKIAFAAYKFLAEFKEDPFIKSTIEEITFRLEHEFKIAGDTNLKTLDDIFLLKKYYLIQLGKTYLQETPNAIKNDEIKRINENLVRILEIKTARGQFGWQVVQQFEKEQAKIFTPENISTQSTETVTPATKPSLKQDPVSARVKQYIYKEYQPAVLLALLKIAGGFFIEKDNYGDAHPGAAVIMQSVDQGLVILKNIDKIEVTQKVNNALIFYYTLQVCKFYRSKMSDDNVAQDVQKINDGLEELLKKVISGQYMWKIIEDFESTNAAAIATATAEFKGK